jgi:hypothetical protein
LREERWQPLLVRNPFAEYPVDEGFLPLPGYAYSLEEHHWAPSKGKTRLADILGLPAIWPPA